MHSASNSTIDPIAANTAAAKIAGNVAASSPRFPSSSSLPADCGRRLLTKVVDEIAVTDPTRVYAAAPVSSDVRDGWVDITYRTLAIAVSRCARWIERGIGRGNGKDVLFYMGPTDLRFPIVFLAALKTGRVAQFSSTRNSLDAHLSLLENSGCKSILLPDDAPNIASNILSRRTMQVVKAPTLEQLLESSDDERENEIYEWRPEFESLRLKTCLILHTSGSTGIPKPVWVTHGAFASNDMHQLIPSLGGRPTFLAENMKQKRVLVAFPLFHAACVTLVVGFGIFHGAISVIPPPGPLTVDVVDRAHTHGNVEGSLMAPSLIVDIYKKPDAYQNLIENVKWIGYTGGPLPAQVGDELARHIKVVTLIGSTETLFLPTENVDEPENWQQVPISPFLGHEYRPTGDGSAELMIVRNKELEKFQGCFCTLPDKTEHSMGDLYTQHPSNPRYWSFAARADDLIAFSTAEKLNPVTIESSLSAHPLVKGALVAGHGQFQASLLVEPNGPAPRTKKEKDAFINELWPAVMEINRSSVAHGRIMKGYILVTSQDRPFVRVPKGVIQRKETLKLYAKEFEALYESKDQTPDKKSSFTSPSADEVKSHNSQNSGNKTGMSLSGACQDCSARKKKEEYTDAKIESLTAQLELLSRSLESALQRLETPSNQGLKITLSISMNGQDIVGSRSGNIDLALPQPTRSIAAPVATYERTNDLPRQHSLPDSQQERCMESEPKALAADSSTPPKLDELAELKDALFEVIQDNAILYKLTASANLFNCGMDSQQVIVVTDAVNERISSTPSLRARRITKTDIYNNPTIEQLAVAMMQC